MYKKLFLLYILLTGLSTLTAQVKIGSTGIPNSNAVLELDGGTSKGLLLPKLTNSEIAALTTAPDGLVVYNKTDNFLYIRKAAAWQKISDATNGSGLTLPYNGSAAIANILFSVTNTTVGDAIWGTGNSGDGINGFSNTGNGGYFTSTSGNALVTRTGNVGIATLSPQFPLDINGRPRIRSNGAFNSAGIWYDRIYTSGQSSFVGTLNDSSFGIYGGGNWKFVFDHINNNFGINNHDPKAPLSFASSVGNKISLWGDATGGHYGIGIQGSLMQLYSSASNADIAFGYGSSTSFTENMRIKGNGNVGIGATNPDAKLLVNGSIKITDGTQGNGKLLTSDASGKASWQSGNVNTGFKVLLATTDFPSGTFVFPIFRLVGNTIYDDGNNFSFNNPGYYTPSAGLYHFDMAFLPSKLPVATGSTDGIFLILVSVNGNEAVRYEEPVPPGTPLPNLNYSFSLKLNANDRVHLAMYQSSGVTVRINYTESSFFSGYKVY